MYGMVASFSSNRVCYIAEKIIHRQAEPNREVPQKLSSSAMVAGGTPFFSTYLSHLLVIFLYYYPVSYIFRRFFDRYCNQPIATIRNNSTKA
jgi:hypothetical protein